MPDCLKSLVTVPCWPVYYVGPTRFQLSRHVRQKSTASLVAAEACSLEGCLYIHRSVCVQRSIGDRVAYPVTGAGCIGMAELALVVGPGRALASMIAAMPYVWPGRPGAGRVIMAGAATYCPGCIPGRCGAWGTTTIRDGVELRIPVTIREIITECSGWHRVAGYVGTCLGGRIEGGSRVAGGVRCGGSRFGKDQAATDLVADLAVKSGMSIQRIRGSSGTMRSASGTIRISIKADFVLSHV